MLFLISYIISRRLLPQQLRQTRTDAADNAEYQHIHRYYRRTRLQTEPAGQKESDEETYDEDNNQGECIIRGLILITHNNLPYLYNRVIE